MFSCKALHKMTTLEERRKLRELEMQKELAELERRKKEREEKRKKEREEVRAQSFIAFLFESEGQDTCRAHANSR